MTFILMVIDEADRMNGIGKNNMGNTIRGGGGYQLKRMGRWEKGRRWRIWENRTDEGKLG